MPDLNEQMQLHWRQYEMLHEEILQRISASWELEFWAVATVAAFYAWFFKEGGNLPSWKIGFIGVLIPAAGLLRAIVTSLRVEDIAGYLREIESRTFTDPALPGWEQHLADLPGLERYLGMDFGPKWSTVVSSSLVWGLLLLITFAAPFVALLWPPQEPP
jgi:hypothetical protein